MKHVCKRHQEHGVIRDVRRIIKIKEKCAAQAPILAFKLVLHYLVNKR